MAHMLSLRESRPGTTRHRHRAARERGSCCLFSQLRAGLGLENHQMRPCLDEGGLEVVQVV